MPLISRKLVQATLRQRIVEEIREAILNRSLLPGERLVERTLAERLGTSLTATREALIQLETEGLITKKPNSTTHVTQLTLKEVEQIYAVRRILERYAFEEAARVANPGAIAHLQELHRKAVETARLADDRAYIAADLGWHEAVWQSTGNTCLADTLRRVVIPLFGFSAITSHHGFNLVRDAQTHAPLLAAIRKRDPVEAGTAFEKFSEVWQQQLLSESESAGIADQAKERRERRRSK